MNRAPVLLALALCACATSHHAEQQAKSDDVSAATSSEAVDVVQHVEEAPDRTTTTVEEFAPPEEDAGSALERTPALPTDPAASRHRAAGPTMPYHGPLVKRTVKVEEHGATVTDTRVEARGAQTKHEEAKVEAQAKTDSTFKPAGILGSLLGLWPLLLAGGLAALAYWRKDLLAGLIKKVLP